MMTTYDVLEYIDMKPFQPLRLRMTGGKTHEILRPGQLSVGIKHVTVFSPEGNASPPSPHWFHFSLESLEAIELIEGSTADGKPSSRS